MGVPLLDLKRNSKAGTKLKVSVFRMNDGVRLYVEEYQIQGSKS